MKERMKVPKRIGMIGLAIVLVASNLMFAMPSAAMELTKANVDLTVEPLTPSIKAGQTAVYQVDFKPVPVNWSMRI